MLQIDSPEMGSRLCFPVSHLGTLLLMGGGLEEHCCAVGILGCEPLFHVQCWPHSLSHLSEQ